MQPPLSGDPYGQPNQHASSDPHEHSDLSTYGQVQPDHTPTHPGYGEQWPGYTHPGYGQQQPAYAPAYPGYGPPHPVPGQVHYGYGHYVQSQPIHVTNSVKPGTSHAFHLILTLFTCGLWLPVWAIMALINSQSRKSTTVIHR